MSNTIIIGYSGHAYVVADAIYSNGGTIAGYTESQKKDSNPFNLEYLGVENDELLSGNSWIVGIGDNKVRKTIIEKYIDCGTLVSVSHKSSIIGGGCKIGNGSFLAARSVLNPLSEIGTGCIINTGAIIEHECEIGNFTHIAPGAVLTGNVHVGNGTFIGANSVVKQGINIGNNVIVGAGSVIIRDIPDNHTVVGNPGRIIRNTTIKNS